MTRGGDWWKGENSLETLLTTQSVQVSLVMAGVQGKERVTLGLAVIYCQIRVVPHDLQHLLVDQVFCHYDRTTWIK